MRIAVRRVRAEGGLESSRSIALPKPGGVAPLVRRPSLPRRPARRLEAALDAPAVSRIVLRSLSLR
jgi:hypothetical protein